VNCVRYIRPETALLIALYTFLNSIVFFNPRYGRFTREYAPAMVPPEKRLEMALFGGPLVRYAF
jgi:hypothetical protein